MIGMLVVCWWYNGGMKQKTSVTLSTEVLGDMDRLAGTARSRSAFIEEILRRYIREQLKAERDAREIEIINRHAGQMNAEVNDALRYQATIDDER
jgi:metal-responsive CopG/Arc/MetJ family transcriptional regulator